MFFRHKPNHFYVMAAIFGCHLLLWLLGNQAIYIDWYVQLAPLEFLKEDSFKAIYYLHGNPPGFSLFWYLTHLAGTWQYPLIHCLLIGLHLLSYYWFQKAIESKFKIVAFQWVGIILFINPLLFIYFKYPFYCTFLFALLCAWLFVQNIVKNKSRQLVYIAIILSLACLFRSSWHIFIAVAILAIYIPRTHISSKIIALLIISIPFSFYFKNKLLFGSFASTSWSAMNWANGNHINAAKGIGTLAPFKTPIDSIYKAYINESDSQVVAFADVPQLNNRSIHDIRIFQINKAYQQALDSNFSIKRSLLIWIKDGLPKYFDSPSNYPFLYAGGCEGKVLFGIKKSSFLLTDFFKGFSLHIKGKSGKITFIPITLYTVLYPLILLVCTLGIRKLSKIELLFLGVLVFFSVAYSFIDYSESNRMRFELEPFWYYFGFKAFTIVQQFRHEKKERKILAVLGKK